MANEVTPTNVVPFWTLEDSEALQHFLATKPGQRMLVRLASLKANEGSWKSSGSAEYTLGRVLQHDELMSEIIRLSTPASAEDRVDVPASPSGGSPNYPDLDDDSAWADEPTKNA